MKKSLITGLAALSLTACSGMPTYKKSSLPIELEKIVSLANSDVNKDNWNGNSIELKKNNVELNLNKIISFKGRGTEEYSLDMSCTLPNGDHLYSSERRLNDSRPYQLLKTKNKTITTTNLNLSVEEGNLLRDDRLVCLKQFFN